MNTSSELNITTCTYLKLKRSILEAQSILALFMFKIKVDIPNTKEASKIKGFGKRNNSSK